MCQRTSSFTAVFGVFTFLVKAEFWGKIPFEPNIINYCLESLET